MGNTVQFELAAEGAATRAMLEDLSEERRMRLGAMLGLYEIEDILKHGASHCTGIGMFNAVALPNILGMIIAVIGNDDEATLQQLEQDVDGYYSAKKLDMVDMEPDTIKH